MIKRTVENALRHILSPLSLLLCLSLAFAFTACEEVEEVGAYDNWQARNEANRVAEKVKEEFPEMPVYTYFQPPRWLCRVGDFKSIEEAHVAMRKLKSTGNFKEVAIVREQINIPIE